MCQLLLISQNNYVEGKNAIGDIVSIVDDDHVFSVQERAGFNIVEIPNVTAPEFIGALKHPEIQTVIDSSGTEHTVWRNNDTDPWKRLIIPSKYTWTVAGVSEDLQVIFQSDTVDKETKLALLTEFGNNTSYQAENNTEVIISVAGVDA